MRERKNRMVPAGFVLAVSLLAASVTAFLSAGYYNRVQIRVLGEICGDAIEREPQAKGAILSALKEYRYGSEPSAEENIICAWGYDRSLFLQTAAAGPLFAAAGFAAGAALFFVTVLLWNKRNTERITRLADSLEKVNTGGDGGLFFGGEDAFSGLWDEIGKTVTELYQTREAAVAARSNFAENLSNIAHQIKTPITAISLSVQMLSENPSPGYLDKIRCQLAHLTRLAEGLLLLSRIDEGTLALEKKETDVFTLLTLAADNLYDLFGKAGVSVAIPEAEPAVIWADMDWTMEALMNLMKNCLEHTPRGGCVCCSYEQNPIYTRIRIWDSGDGFAREDLPHLFERFYRGRNAGSGGIGIGLALSKAIIESQNGTVGACNLPEGGACFEVRMYCH